MDKKKRIIHDFAEALRPLTPDADRMTDQEVCDRWTYGGILHSEEEYGDCTCTCGHPIKHVYYIKLRSNPFVQFHPVGSECVCGIFGRQDMTEIKQKMRIDADLWTIWDVFQSQKREYNELIIDEEIVCAGNGFSPATVRWLAERLGGRKGEYLSELSRKRTNSGKTIKQLSFLHYIAQEIETIIRNTVIPYRH